MINAITIDDTTTATVCRLIDGASGQIILENSDFKPAQRLDTVFFSTSAITISFTPITWFPCVKCVSYRTCSTCSFPFCLDESSCLLSYCNYAADILCMPMLFLCAQLPPPLSFSLCFSMPKIEHKKKTYFRRLTIVP